MEVYEKMIEDKINAEILEAKKKYGNNWRKYYFNNFHSLLPGGFRRRYSDKTLEFRNEEYQGKTLNEVFNEIDSMIRKYNIPLENILYLQKKGRDARNILVDLCIPVYIELRKINYKRNDLSR